MKSFVTEINKDYSLLDNHTGEIKELKRTRVVNVDEFIMFFFASIPELCKLDGLQLKILMCCWKNSTYSKVESEGNIVVNNRLLKDYIKQNVETTDAAIDVCFHRLTERGILVRKCKGTYLLNPKYFFKGSLAKKSKLELRILTEGK